MQRCWHASFSKDKNVGAAWSGKDMGQALQNVPYLFVLKRLKTPMYHESRHALCHLDVRTSGPSIDNMQLRPPFAGKFGAHQAAPEVGPPRGLQGRLYS